MEDSLAVIVCSRENSEQKKDFIQHIKDTCECNAHVFFLINEDGVGLTSIYEDMLKSNKVENNILVFIHDDIEFLKKGWGAEIIRLFNEHKDYGIIGVAGSAQFDENGAWWQYDKKYGQVLHRHDGKSWLTSFSPLLKKDLQEVCVIDGLFMAVDKKRVTEGFDTDFKGFNHYDTSFCLANYIDGRTKIGVTTNIRIAHNSIGEMKPEWYTNRDKLNAKFGKYYPIDVDTDHKRRDKDKSLKIK